MIKPVGVMGLTVAITLCQLLFLLSVRKTSRIAFALALLSFLGFAFTIVMAWQNELGTTSLRGVLGVRTMVSLHGVLNGVIVAPCFLIALHVAQPKAVHQAT